MYKDVNALHFVGFTDQPSIIYTVGCLSFVLSCHVCSNLLTVCCIRFVTQISAEFQIGSAVPGTCLQALCGTKVWWSFALCIAHPKRFPQIQQYSFPSSNHSLGYCCVLPLDFFHKDKKTLLKGSNTEKILPSHHLCISSLHWKLCLTLYIIQKIDIFFLPLSLSAVY